MSTVNINDLKIRALQLKGLGYDKLLKKEDLNSQIITLDKELDTIAAEVKNIMTTLEQIETASNETTSSTNEISDDSQKQSSDSSHDTPTQKSHVMVDEKELGNILNPQSSVGKENKDRKNKTSHSIGRRS